MSNVKFKHVPVRVFLVCWVPPLVCRIHQGRLERSRGCSESRIRPYRSFSFGNKKKNILFCTACYYYKYDIFLKLRQEKKLLGIWTLLGLIYFPCIDTHFLQFYLCIFFGIIVSWFSLLNAKISDEWIIVYTKNQTGQQYDDIIVLQDGCTYKYSKERQHLSEQTEGHSNLMRRFHAFKKIK